MISKMGRAHTSFYRRNVLQTSFSIKISRIWLWEKMEENILVLARASTNNSHMDTVWNVLGGEKDTGLARALGSRERTSGWFWIEKFFNYSEFSVSERPRLLLEQEVACCLSGVLELCADGCQSGEPRRRPLKPWRLWTMRISKVVMKRPSN